jgi:hypothetical protein
MFARLKVFRAMKIQVEVSGVAMPCSIVVGYQPEDGGGMTLQNTSILPQHYMVPQPRRPQLESSCLGRITGHLEFW